MKPAQRRRVAVVTGTRAEYGLLKSTMEAVRAHANLKLQVVVTGMHLLRKFGHTVDEVVRDGWRIDARIRMQRGNDDSLDQAAGLARGVAGIARFLRDARTDVVVVLGDRIEALAGALAAVTTGRFLAHVHGGDVAAGDFDDSLRHAITKLAHFHFAATQAARGRIIQMGEPSWRVHWVGAPGLDRLMALLRDESEPRAEWNPACAGAGAVVRDQAELRASGRASKPPGRALIVQHPCGRSAREERRVMNAILTAVTSERLQRTIVYPNSDRGHSGIVGAIESHVRRQRNGAVRVVRSLDHDGYLKMLMAADVLVGNSSSGIIEAATAGTAAVNVGSRQEGRERSGASVVDAVETVPSIRRALRRALRMEPIIGKKTAYGDGTAGGRIAEILAKLELSEATRRKVNMF